ncbi:MAG: aminotransferase class V-fold PLP-dependent enzyme [Pirellulaceae bacterium]|jgi:cysteine desulfurase|nr:aminotransferase class V-fold PLP-dependent enzyme [Pirellulaceae bacterium]
MVAIPVYMDNHATTRVDPRVVEAMLPFFTETYGNMGSTSHSFGWDAAEAVDAARNSIATSIGCSSRELVFTSGATESNNLALRGIAHRNRRTGGHLISVTTEHKAILDPLQRLGRRGCDVTLIGVKQAGATDAGRVDIQRILDALTDNTLLVSVMLANNEIGVIQQLAELGQECQSRGVLLLTDATQAVGRIPVNVDELHVDLMSFSAHKMYGPKGVGALYVRRRSPRIKIDPQIDGGGQEGGRRSGTLNVSGIVGLAHALTYCQAEMNDEMTRLATLRNRLYTGLMAGIDDVSLNGPVLDDLALRLPGNLNCSFSFVDGEALMMSMRDLAVSSGSACTSANPEPSHVLRALGLNDDQTRASLRFGLGRFTTEEEVDFAVETVTEAVQRLRRMSSLAK